MRNRQRVEYRRESVGVEVIQRVQLAGQNRQLVASLPMLDERDGIELRVIRGNGEVQTARLPPKAAGMVKALLDALGREERVVLLSEGLSFRADLGPRDG